MKARRFLQARTGEAHERVDAAYSHFDLSDAAGYRAFLTAQAEAHLAVEAALDAAGAERLLADWPQRRRGGALRQDLADLGASAEADPTPLRLEDEAEMLGAVYVLEGSRLGGAVLKKQLPPSAPRRFLDQDQAPGAWRKLLEILEEALYNPARLEAAARAAGQVFDRFEAAACRVRG